MTGYTEDGASDEFASIGNSNNVTGPSNEPTNNNQPCYQPPINNQSLINHPTYTPPTSNNQAAPPTFFQINVKARADNTSNGCSNTGLVGRRGQRLRITASGSVNLGSSRMATPAGLPDIPDSDKLIRNQPTDRLIALIG